MILLFSKIVYNFLNICLGYLAFLTIVVPIEQEFTNGDFFFRLMNEVPSQIAIGFGVIYLFLIVADKALNVWHRYRMHNFEEKQSEEDLNKKKRDNETTLEQ